MITKLLLLALTIAFSVSAYGGETQPNTAQMCYLPTQSNVDYSAVQALPVSSPNHVLAYGDNSLQFAELWLPISLPSSKIKQRHPLVVLIHGGCWLNSFDVRHTHALSTALAQSGYAVWSVEYRRTGDEGGGWPGSYNDIKAAVAYLPELSEYPIDLDNIAIVGHSAGGHLALLAGADKLYDFNAVVGLAAIVDLEQYSRGDNSCQTATPQFMGGTASELPKAYLKADPAKLDLHKSTVLIHGDQDSIVPFEHATTSSARSRIIEGGGHFDMIHPGTLSYQALLRELADAFREKS